MALIPPNNYQYVMLTQNEAQSLKETTEAIVQFKYISFFTIYIAKYTLYIAKYTRGDGIKEDD